MAKFMGNCEGGREPIVLHNGTRGIVIAHRAQLRQPKRVTLLEIRIPTNGLPACVGTTGRTISHFISYFYSLISSSSLNL